MNNISARVLHHGPLSHAQWIRPPPSSSPSHSGQQSEFQQENNILFWNSLRIPVSEQKTGPEQAGWPSQCHHFCKGMARPPLRQQRWHVPLHALPKLILSCNGKLRLVTCYIPSLFLLLSVACLRYPLVDQHCAILSQNLSSVAVNT